MGSKFPSKWIIWVVVIVAVGAIFFALFMRSPGVATGSLDDLVTLTTKGSVQLADDTLVEGNIDRIVHQGTTVIAMDGDTSVLEAGFSESTHELEENLEGRGVDWSKVKLDYQPPSGFDWGILLTTLLPLLFFILLFTLMIGLIWFIFSRARGAGKGAPGVGDHPG